MQPLRTFATAFRPFDTDDVDPTIDATVPPASQPPTPVDLVRATTVEAGPRYDVKSVLGRGGMGEVRLCRDSRIGREVAIKIAHAAKRGAEDVRARFLREARVQGQLEHPAIVPVYDLEIFDDGSAYFAMKRVRGKTLAAILGDLRRGDEETLKRMPLRKLLGVLGSVCLAVDFAHQKGVVHRDIKPGNIMVGDFGEVYILDWGLAKLTGQEDEADTIDTGPVSAGTTQEEAETIAGSLLGTPGYMAPEQIDGSIGPLGPATDVYALGAVLFEIVALERYIQASDPIEATVLTLQGPEPRPSVRTGGRATEALDDICAQALARSPAARTPSARALHEAIDQHLAGEHDLERRRALATRHLEEARRAPDTLEGRSRALRELGGALGLDPQNVDAQRELFRLIQSPPRTTPDAVREQVHKDEERRIRELARLRKISGVTYLPFVPIVIALGVLDWTLFVLAFGCVGLTSAVNAWVERRNAGNRVLQVAGHATFLLAAFGLAFMAGPLILLPAVLVGYTAEIQMHPRAAHRTGTLLAGLGLLAALFLLDQLGVVGPFYSVVEGGLLIHENVVRFEGAAVTVLWVASLATLVTPSLFMARIRAELARAEERLHVQAWQLGEIVPPEAKRG
jgi:eukaryotic-like serine/threonine-protein kinase